MLVVVVLGYTFDDVDFVVEYPVVVLDYTFDVDFVLDTHRK